MSRERSRRLKIFDTFEPNLTAFIAEGRGNIVCPYCFRAFNRQHAEEGILTIAHSWPEALGGTTGPLACAECNGKTNRFDSHLVRQYQINERMEGHGVGVRLSFGQTGNELSTGCLLQIRSLEPIPTLEIGFHPGHYDKRVVDAVFEGGLSGQFHLEFPIANDRKVDLALLNTAHLAMFSVFGYEWILSRCGHLVRHQIRNSDTPLMSPQIVIGNLHPLPGSIMVALIILDNDEPAFAIVIPRSPLKPQTATLIYLPLFDQTPYGWETPSNPITFQALEAWRPFPKHLAEKGGHLSGQECLIRHGLRPRAPVEFFGVTDKGDPLPQVLTA